MPCVRVGAATNCSQDACEYNRPETSRAFIESSGHCSEEGASCFFRHVLQFFLHHEVQRFSHQHIQEDRSSCVVSELGGGLANVIEVVVDEESGGPSGLRRGDLGEAETSAREEGERVGGTND